MTTTSHPEENSGSWVSAGMETLRDYFGEEDNENGGVTNSPAAIAPKQTNNNETADPVPSSNGISTAAGAAAPAQAPEKGDNEEKNTPSVAENSTITVEWCAVLPETSDGSKEDKTKVAKGTEPSQPGKKNDGGVVSEKKVVAAAATMNNDNKRAALPPAVADGDLDDNDSSKQHRHQASRKRPRLKKNASSSSTSTNTSSNTEDYDQETSSDEDESHGHKKKAITYSPETAAAMAELQQPGMVTLPLSCLTGKIIESPEGLALLLAPHPTLKTAAEYVAAYGWNNRSSHEKTVVDTHNRRWTRAEDEILKHGVEELGGVPPHNWKEIARSFFPGTRHHNQVRCFRCNYSISIWTETSLPRLT